MTAIDEMTPKALPFSTSTEDKQIDREVMNICIAMIKESRRLRTIPEPKETELWNMALTWAKELQRYAPAEIVEMFDRAKKEWKDSKQVLGVPELLAARDSIERERRQTIIRTAPAPSCAGHDLVDMPREQDDPPLIVGWSICRHCNAPFPKWNLKGKAGHYLNLVAVNTA